MVKKTAIYDIHLKLEGKMVEYADYYLPVQYTSIIKEHLAVRNDAGVFDVSHMGEILIENNALQFIDYVVCNNVLNLKGNKIRYSPMLNYSGGIVDDLLIYCFDENKCVLVVNAVNKDKDYKWLCDNAKFGVKITDISAKVSQIAIQGKNANKYLSKYINDDLLPKTYYSFEPAIPLFDQKVLVSRNGYTGEDGYEIYGNEKAINTLFEKLVEDGITPCGLGARDTLRLEAGMPLYGHEMNDDISPLDTGLEKYCSNNGDYIGKSNLKNKGLTRVGIKMLTRGILRENLDLFNDNSKVGKTTSGTYLPAMKASYAMAIIDKNFSDIGQKLKCRIRDKDVEVEVCEIPFYKR